MQGCCFFLQGERAKVEHTEGPLSGIALEHHNTVGAGHVCVPTARPGGGGPLRWPESNDAFSQTRCFCVFVRISFHLSRIRLYLNNSLVFAPRWYFFFIHLSIFAPLDVIKVHVDNKAHQTATYSSAVLLIDLVRARRST